MASSQPIIRQVQWLSLIPQVIVSLLIILVYDRINVGDPVLLGVFTYLLIFLAVRNLIARHHRKGLRHFKNYRYEEAMREFQKSYDFFQRYQWIDKYRYITLLSSSRISYLEMAMLNMAYCYGQLGEGSKSKEMYQLTLERFPDSKIAEATLKMFAAVKYINE